MTLDDSDDTVIGGEPSLSKNQGKAYQNGKCLSADITAFVQDDSDDSDQRRAITFKVP